MVGTRGGALTSRSLRIPYCFPTRRESPHTNPPEDSWKSFRKQASSYMRNDLEALLKRLLEHQIDMVVVGGFASVLHGSPIVTRDLDICISINEKEILKLRKALRDLAPLHRMNPSVKPSFLEFPEKLDGWKNIYLETSLGILDAMSELAPIGDFERIKSRSVEISLFGYPCRVISVEDLLEIKRTMNRPKDKETVLYLEEILRQLNRP